MTERWDVAVAGAGPAGSACAYLLARQGWRVVLLDRARFPRPKACAEYMSPGVVETLARMGLSGTLAGAQPVRGMEVISPAGRRLRLQYEVNGTPRSAVTLPRRTLDARLVEEAAKAGAEVVEGLVVRGPLLDAGAVSGVVGSHTGRPHEVRARLTIVADGARSSLSGALGLTRVPRWPLRLGLVAHYEGPAGLSDGFGQMHVAPTGYCGVAPLPDGRLNVAMVLPFDALRRSGLSATQYFERWIGERPRLAEALAACRRISSVRGMGPVGARVRRPWAPGALLVGDAAGFFDPFTGEGIYRALTGAELAAEVGGRALQRGDPSEESLRPYERMRISAFRSKQAVTALVQLFVQYPSLMEYALPRLGQRAATARTLGAVLGDVEDARRFLAPQMLWSALRP